MEKLYTRTGDDGYTETLNGERISKTDDIIELIGTLDEFSASLGVARAYSEDKSLIEDIVLVQKMLIEVMGELAGGRVCITKERVADIETMTDRYAGKFCGFTISGENIPSARLNLSRCIIRRAERVAAKLLCDNRIRKETFSYLNRLSDLMYAMSRYAENG